MMRSDIHDLFEKHGILPTQQRVEVAEVLLVRPQHLSAEQIIDRLNRQGSSVSKATVYNTLKLFGKHGLVKEIMADPVRKYYDSSTHAHHHFFNVDTGELHDIADCDVSVGNLPSLPEGTRQESVEVLIRIRQTEN